MEQNPITEFATQYLHEDWDFEHPDIVDVVAQYMDDTDRSNQLALGKALIELLNKSSSENSLEQELRLLDWQVFFEDMPTSMVIQQISASLLSDK